VTYSEIIPVTGSSRVNEGSGDILPYLDSVWGGEAADPSIGGSGHCGGDEERLD
jgi:hypothetical protein